MKNAFFLCCLLMIFVSGHSQPPPPEKWVKIIVSPEKPDWTYKTGENVKFNIKVFKSNVLLDGAKVSVEIGPEKMPATITKELTLKDGSVTIDGGTMKDPGFLRCTVKTEYDGKTYREWTTAGFSPEAIKPTVTVPSDFREFWSKAVEENNKLPFDTKMTLLPERCTDLVNVYHVSLQNWRPGARVYGILTIPKKEGKYPAVLKVPGAGVRPYNGDVGMAASGIICLEIGIHGISVIMPQQNYDDISASWTNQYWVRDLHDKDKYYYKRVYLGCVRANDFLTSLPQWDGQNLGVMGSSQGGALSLVTAGMDKRVTCAAPTHPAMVDMTGTLFDRAGGWPQPFGDKLAWKTGSHQDRLQTVPYYDALNFAREIKVPVFFTFGYNDDVCPPTSVFAAYNIITAPKEKFLALETAHWIFPEQAEKQREWMIKQLKK